MNTAQTIQEKRTIRVKDFLDDVRSGMNDRQLLQKYYLSELGLEKFYAMLEERGILTAEDIQLRKTSELASERDVTESCDERSSYICPCCLASHDTMFDICPSCGVSFHQLISQGKTAEPKLSADSVDRIDTRQQNAPESAPQPSPVCAAEHDGPTGVTSDKPVVACDAPASPGSATEEHDEFMVKESVPRFDSMFDDSLDEVVSGIPLDHVAPCDTLDHAAEVVCQSCDRAMEPAIRNIYDRGSSLNALFLSGVFIVLGLVAATALTFFGGQSLQRLAVFFTTAVFILIGSVFFAVGSFLLLAREKVYRCPSCKRVFPRA
jgi:hypothetical protein